MIDRLEQIWHAEIPISKAMGIRAVSFDGTTLQVKAPLANNINVHGTAFAGSLYAVAALCGWGTTWLQLEQRKLGGSIVIAEGHINYAAPVSGDIEVSCTFDPAVQREALAKLDDSGRCRFALTVEIGNGAAQFEGSYAVRLGNES